MALSLVAAGAQKNGIGNACYPRNIVAMPTEALWQDGASTMLQPPFNTPTVLDNSDVLVFPLKVYQLQQAITQWLPYLENTPTIVLLHAHYCLMTTPFYLPPPATVR